MAHSSMSVHIVSVPVKPLGHGTQTPSSIVPLQLSSSELQTSGAPGFTVAPVVGSSLQSAPRTILGGASDGPSTCTALRSHPAGAVAPSHGLLHVATITESPS